MSVSYSAELWYGVPLSAVDMGELSQERQEALITCYTVCASEWVNNDDTIYLGVEVAEVDDIDQVCPLTRSDLDPNKADEIFWRFVHVYNLKIRALPQYYLILRSM